MTFSLVLSPQLMGVNEGLYPRRAEESMKAALEDTRVVVINSARQTGKSTLARLVAERRERADVRIEVADSKVGYFRVGLHRLSEGP